MFNSNATKSKVKLKIAEIFKNKLEADKVLVKSYRIEKEKIDDIKPI
jgi:hypothetical protein